MTPADAVLASAPASIWTVQWHDTAATIPAELWQTCFAPPVEGRWWYDALERSGLESQFRFRYAVVEQDGTPVGLAPAFVHDVPIDLVAPPPIAKVLRVVGRVIPRLRYQRTLFVGSPCSDEGTFGLCDGVDRAVAVRVLQEALQLQARADYAAIIVWKDFPKADAAAFTPLVAAGRLFRVVSYPGTRVDLPGPDFAGFLKSITSSHRHQLKKKLKRSRETGMLNATIIQRPDEATLAEVFGLFWQTYEKGKTKFEVLNVEFFRQISSFDGAHYVLLRDGVTENLVAFMLCFHIGDRVINKFIGIDYAYGGNWYLYFRLLETAIDWASKQGATDFQSGQTGYRAKTDVGHSLVPLTNYCRHRSRPLHLLFARIARGIDWSSLDDDLKTWVTAHPEASQVEGADDH